MKSIKSSLDFIFLVLQNKTKICIFYFTVIHIVLKNLGILDIRTFTFSDEKKETQLLIQAVQEHENIYRINSLLLV